MIKKHPLYLILVLISMALVMFLYKAVVLDVPLISKAQTEVWHIEAHLAFIADKKPVKISMNLPRNSHRFALVNESFISRGYGVNVVTEDGRRKVHWSIRRARGNQNLFYRASVKRMDREVPAQKPEKDGTKKPEFKDAYREASETLLSEAREKSADTEGIVLELIRRLNNPQPDDNVTLLLGKKASVQKKLIWQYSCWPWPASTPVVSTAFGWRIKNAMLLCCTGWRCTIETNGYPLIRLLQGAV